MLGAVLSPPAISAPAYGTYAWPVRGPVIRPFAAPDSPYGAGHRGIDIGTPTGTTVVAASAGVVAFAGRVGTSLFVSIDHPDGVRTTYSWLEAVLVERGRLVRREEPVGRSGNGHPESSEPHLHLGARIGREYMDPMLLLERAGTMVHLAKSPEPGASASTGGGTAAPLRPVPVNFPGTPAPLEAIAWRIGAGP